METTGNTHAAPRPPARTDWPRSFLRNWLGCAWRHTRAFAHWYSEHCRRVRAYQDLARVSPASLHAVLTNPAEQGRMLEGLSPRRCNQPTQRER